jgi:branched-chain amino acid transport system substrate-binding protein
MKATRAVACLATLALIAASAACTSSATGSSGTGATSTAGSGTPSQPFKMYAFMALSGPLAAVGDAMKQGLEAGVDVINAHGGVFGKPMTLDVEDDAGDPTQAATLAQSLVSSTTPMAVDPGTVSGEVDAALPVLAKANVFVAYNTSDPTLNNPAKYPYAFSTAFAATDPANSLATEFAQMGYKKVGVITTDDTAGHALYQAEEAAYQSKGISSSVAYVSQSATSATSQMLQVLASHPDALLLDTYGAAAVPVMAAKAELDPKIPVYGSQYLTANNLAQIAPASSYAGMKLQSIGLAVQGATVTKTTAFTAMQNALLKETGGKLTFTIYTYTVAYDAVIVAATAAKLTNGMNSEKMAAAVVNATAAQMPLFVGPVNYSSTDHDPTFGPDYWSFVNYGPIDNGMLVPGS